MAEPIKPDTTEWPPFPNVILGKGRWAHLVKVLRLHGSQESHRLANTIQGQIDDDPGTTP